MTDINNLIDRINEEIGANTKILLDEIPGGLSVKARTDLIAKSPKTVKTQARNELLLTRKLELESLISDIAIELGYTETKQMA